MLSPVPGAGGYDDDGRGWGVDRISIFWIGMAVMSVLCALSVWKAKARD